MTAGSSLHEVNRPEREAEQLRVPVTVRSDCFRRSVPTDTATLVSRPPLPMSTSPKSSPLTIATNQYGSYHNDYGSGGENR